MAEARFSNLALRIASALVLIPVALAATWLGGWIFLALVLLAAGLMLSEWDRMAGMTLDWRFAGKLAVLGLALVCVLWARPELALVLVLVAALGAVVLSLSDRNAATWAAGGVLYIGLPCIALIWLREQSDSGFVLALWLLTLVWATDIGAYATGRMLGGPKLAPRISPNKTWAGLCGGIVAAMLAGVGIGRWAGFADLQSMMLASGGLAVVAQLGDLTESAVKRHFKVKDAGQYIPGHGGALDRLDGMLFAVPVAALMLLLLNGVDAWR